MSEQAVSRENGAFFTETLDGKDYCTRYTSASAQGEKFKDTFTIYGLSEDETNYRLELLNVN